MTAYIVGLSPEEIEQVRPRLRRSEGIFGLPWRCQPRLGGSDPDQTLIALATGEVFYLLQVEPDRILRFVYAYPGLGTREASLSLDSLKTANRIRIRLVWAPEVMTVYADAKESGDFAGDDTLVGEGQPSERRYRVIDGNNVIELGPVERPVDDILYFEGGVVHATAIEAWNNTLTAVDVLITGQGADQELFELVAGNVAVVTLVTGFETYCKRRLIELEGEGISADFSNLARKFLTRQEREVGEEDVIRRLADERGVSPTELLVAT